MSVLFLIIIILGVTGQNVTKKMYTNIAGANGAYLFSALTSLFSMLFFVVTSKDINWNLEIVPYSIAFAISFATASLFGLLAVMNGPLSLTSLMVSYSLMIPTFYGIVFLKEDVNIYFWIGLILLATSIFLVNKKNDACRVTPKWLLFVFLSFVGNGLCSTFQKVQQVAFDGDYKNEFMIIALAIVVMIFIIAALITNKKDIKSNLRHASFIAPATGVMNGVVNLLTMVLSAMIPVSVMFPLVSAGGIVTTYLVSKIFYKEKLSKAQFIGFIIGILSIIFLNV